MIELDNIKKHYALDGKDVLILKGINLFIAQGEFVSIMGPSGSGKSTLSAILGCLSTPSSGTYKLNGQDVTSLRANEIARLRNSSIGFIFQDFNLLSGLTAVENVELPLVYSGMNAKSRRARAMECLSAVSLAHKAQNRPFQLSGGQKQRVAIARALVNQPKFLFADEPTGALDKKTGHEILSIMQKLNLMGQTVIQVTHSPSDALYSKRIIHLVDGNIVREEMVEKPTIGSSTLTEHENSKKDDLVSKLWRVVQAAPVTGAQDLPAIYRLIDNSSSRDAQIAAARALIKWADQNVENHIEALFSSDDWVVRAEILNSMNLRPKKESIPYYIRALSDINPWVRHIAMSELKFIPQTEVPTEGQAVILTKWNDPDERVRASLIMIVGKWNVEGKQALIKNALEDLDNRVRANAVESILDRDTQEQFLEKLIQMSKSDKNNRVRANAAMVVSKFQPETAMRIAEEMTASTDTIMRSSGAWLIGMIQSKSGTNAMIHLIRNEKEEIVTNQVIKSLAKMSQDRFPLTEQVDVVLGPQSRPSTHDHQNGAVT